MAHQNKATGSWTIPIPKDARTGKFRVIESKQATREEPVMAKSAREPGPMTYAEKRQLITRVVGNSIDHDKLEQNLKVTGVIDELEGVIWGPEAKEIRVDGTKDGEDVSFIVAVNL